MSTKAYKIGFIEFNPTQYIEMRVHLHEQFNYCMTFLLKLFKS